MRYPEKYSEKAVQKAIKELFGQLPELTPDTIFLVLMNGGIWFSHELLKHYGNMPVVLHYAKVTSYEGKERGKLNLDFMPAIDWKGKTVIVLDDICDTGTTVKVMHNYLKEHKAGSILFATMIERADADLPADIHVISAIHDASGDFFVGCGLDDNGCARNLPYIGVC